MTWGDVEYCPSYPDGIHCDHWWDDEGPCCGCGDDTEYTGRDSYGVDP